MEDIHDLIFGFIYSQAIYVMAKLKIADQLAIQPSTAQDLAVSVSADSSSLLRLLRALTTVNVLYEDDQGCFSLTPRGELLRSDHPYSARTQVLMACGPHRWPIWGDFYETILTGEGAHERIYGKHLFEFLGEDPEELAIFQATMTSQTRRLLPAILAAYDFSPFNTIVDIGGGQGTLLDGILEQYPQINGIVYDLPEVVAEASEQADAYRAKRGSFVAGDIFQSAPPSADCFILKRILHDWSDSDALKILKQVRQAANYQSKLLVMDAVLLPSNQPDRAKWLDLRLLLILNGRERSEPEFRELFAAAGWKLVRTVNTGELSILESLPI